MLQKVGLLLKDNDEQIPFAYKLYTRTDPAGIRLSSQFKTSFSRDVQVTFVGVWDTVSSVGVITAKTLPFTDANKGIKTFRHALALDERRARFRPNLWHRPSPPPHEPTPTPVSLTQKWRRRAQSSLNLPRVAPRNPDREEQPERTVKEMLGSTREEREETQPSVGTVARGLLFDEPLPVQSTISGATTGPSTVPASLPPLSPENTLKGETLTPAARLRSFFRRAQSSIVRSGAASPSSLPGSPLASPPVSPEHTLKSEKTTPPKHLKSVVQRATNSLKHRSGASPSSSPASLPASPPLSAEHTLKNPDRPDTLRAHTTSTRLARIQSLVRRHPGDPRLHPHYRRGSHSDSDLADLSRALRAASPALSTGPEPSGERPETDVLEVWFPGTHADVGGGNVPNETHLSLAQVTLRWMVREASSAQCGIAFDARALRRLAVQPMVDRLNLKDGLPWYVLEWIPTVERWQDREGRWKRKWW
jgi:hypothetical protein